MQVPTMEKTNKQTQQKPDKNNRQNRDLQIGWPDEFPSRM